MKLTFEQVKSITEGAVRVENKNGFIHFYRFTDVQEELYKISNPDFYKKTFSTAGIKLLFKTDSENFSIRTGIVPASSRTYFSFDVFVNNEFFDSLNNFENTDIPQFYAQIKLPNEEKFEKNFKLGKGEKTVCVYFPWSVAPVVEEICIDDGTSVTPVKHSKKLLAFGDSITHGYDALHPSNRYISRVADSLDAEEINKAIGGEFFFPKLAESKENFVPDYITVAYGTNDWCHMDTESFLDKCKRFYSTLSELYPETPIFAITPIWRKDLNDTKKFGPFENVEKYIKELTADLKNVVVIRGFDFVPQDEKCFADSFLHPNDKGFDFYYNGLIEEIRKHI